MHPDTSVIPAEDLEGLSTNQLLLLCKAVEACYGASLGGLLHSLKNKEMLLCCVDGEKAVFTMELLTYPEGTEVYVAYMAGSGQEEWLPAATRFVENYAKEIGANRVSTYTRMGSTKQFRQLGYLPDRVLVSKEV